MDYLSLFSGAGGGDFACQHKLSWRCRGYVEFDSYCQKLLRARIKDGLLDEAPIFGDVRTFISEGYAASYKGLVDAVVGGFPCQPYSNAGQKKGRDDERDMWPSTAGVLWQVRPKIAFLENTPGLLVRGFGTVLSDLYSIGYDAKWAIVSAQDCGALHRRQRLWIVANTNKSRMEG